MSTSMTEIRSVRGVEVRADGAGQRRIAGYAAKFGKQSRDLGGFIEIIRESTFNRSRGNGWPHVRARYNHDTNYVLGASYSGTLDLTIDSVGLHYSVLPPATRADVLELVERGDVCWSSFAFRSHGAGADEWGLSEQGYPLRSLLSVELVDVAPVSDPAYWDTTSGAGGADGAYRSLARHTGATLRDIQRAAASNDLRGLLARTDGAGPRAHANPTVVDLAPVADHAAGARARMALLERRRVDPHAVPPVRRRIASTTPLSGAEALGRLLELRTGPCEVSE